MCAKGTTESEVGSQTTEGERPFNPAAGLEGRTKWTAISKTQDRNRPTTANTLGTDEGGTRTDKWNAWGGNKGEFRLNSIDSFFPAPLIVPLRMISSIQVE